MRIGLDFDNTIAGYDDLFLRIGMDMGWLPAGFAGTKKAIRDQVRLLPQGNDKWTEMQALAYGRYMPQASIYPGVAEFMRRALELGHDLYIVSHKTQFAAADPGGVDLRQASLDWMTAQGFFHKDRVGMDITHVFFESTRPEKCERIRRLECAVFIDDLEEVFVEPSFPKTARRILFHTGDEPAPLGDFEPMTNWKDIQDDLL